MLIKKIILAVVFCGCFSLIPFISGCAAEEEAEVGGPEEQEMEVPDLGGDEEGEAPPLE